MAGIYVRRLVNAPGRDDAPRLLRGREGSAIATAHENKLGYEIDFLAGYSCGLFPDQRANREILRDLGVKRLLEYLRLHLRLFRGRPQPPALKPSASICAKVSLARGRRKLRGQQPPRWMAIVSSPTTFSTYCPGWRGGAKNSTPSFLIRRHFRAGQKSKSLPGGKRLWPPGGVGRGLAPNPGPGCCFPPNCSSLDATSLREIAQTVLPGRLKFTASPAQPDVPAGRGSTSVWVQLPESSQGSGKAAGKGHDFAAQLGQGGFISARARRRRGCSRPPASCPLP